MIIHMIRTAVPHAQTHRSSTGHSRGDENAYVMATTPTQNEDWIDPTRSGPKHSYGDTAGDRGTWGQEKSPITSSYLTLQLPQALCGYGQCQH